MTPLESRFITFHVPCLILALERRLISIHSLAACGKMQFQGRGFSPFRRTFTLSVAFRPTIGQRPAGWVRVWFRREVLAGRHSGWDFAETCRPSNFTHLPTVFMCWSWWLGWVLDAMGDNWMHFLEFVEGCEQSLKKSHKKHGTFQKFNEFYKTPKPWNFMKNLWKAFKLNFNGMNDFPFPALPGCCGHAKRCPSGCWKGG